MTPLLFDHLGTALRWLREARGQRQYEVAAAAGITKAMLSAYETGRQKPSIETLEKLLQALGCDLHDLDDALRIFGRGQRGRRRAGARLPAAPRYRMPEPAGEVAEPPGTDLYGILGVRGPLPAAKEEALSEMLDGFHKLLRYLHDSAEARCTEGEDSAGKTGPES